MIVDQDLVRSARHLRGWSQSHLAAVMEVSPRTVQRIEKEGRASLETMQTLCAVLELDAETLCTTKTTAPTRSRDNGAVIIMVFSLGIIVGVMLAEWVHIR